MESLVGNIGGYIGLFLGYALLNLPTLFLSMVEFIKKRLIEKKAVRQPMVTDVLSNNKVSVVIGKTTVMMNTAEDRKLQTMQELKCNVEKCYDIIKNMDKRLKVVEQQPKM